MVNHPREKMARRGFLKTIVISYIYINDLLDGLFSGARLFADDTSLFSMTMTETTIQRGLAIKLSNGRGVSILTQTNRQKK